MRKYRVILIRYTNTKAITHIGTYSKAFTISIIFAQREKSQYSHFCATKFFHNANFKIAHVFTHFRYMQHRKGLITLTRNRRTNPNLKPVTYKSSKLESRSLPELSGRQ